MNLVKVYLDNGNSILTKVDGTHEEISNYYQIGRLIHIGLNEELHKIIKLEYIF